MAMTDVAIRMKSYRADADVNMHGVRPGCLAPKIEVGCQKQRQYVILSTGGAPMTARIRYTREFKEQAVNMVLEDGLSQIETAERLSLSPTPLGYWIRTAKAGRTSQRTKGPLTRMSCSPITDPLQRESSPCICNRGEKLMKGKKHHSPEQVIKLLAESDTRLNAGQSIAQVCQTMGIAESTFHRWRNQYGGMKGEEANRLKELEKENARLKRICSRSWQRETSEPGAA